MRAIFSISVAVAVVLFSSADLARAEEAPGAGAADEPSIEEMLSTIEAARARSPSTRPATASATGGAASSSPARVDPAARTRRPAAAPKPPPDVEAELKGIKSRGDLRARFYQMQKKLWHLCELYMKFESHKKAIRVFPEMIRRRMYNIEKSPVPNALDLVPLPHYYFRGTYLDRAGYFEAMCARSLASLGHDKAARQMLAEASAKLAAGSYVPTTVRGFTQKAQQFVSGYPQSKRKVEELDAALAETPNAEVQWELVRHCSPHANLAVMPLRWIEGLLVMCRKYPEHPQVADGTAHWVLFRAFRYFEMHDKCVGLLDEIAEKFPKLKLSIPVPHEHVAVADILWEKAESYVRLALMQEEIGDPRSGLGSYRKALECFELFKKTYPKDRRSNTTKNEAGTISPARADTRMEVLYAAIGRLSR